MWSSRGGGRLQRFGVAVTLLTSLALSACSGFSPVYGERGVITPRLELSYAEPSNRLEQIVYHDLALRLGEGRGTERPVVTVAVSDTARQLTLSKHEESPRARQVTVVGFVSIVDPDGQVRFNGTRSASASYTADKQILADESARRDAGERAAHALAEIVRLTIVGALATAPQ